MECGIFLTDLHTVLFLPQLLPCIGNLKLYNQYCKVIFHIYQEQKEFLSSDAAQIIVQKAENRGTRPGKGLLCLAKLSTEFGDKVTALIFKQFV